MSTLPLRSGTGCFTCKCRRKKCDETKPECLRCQKSGLECPGYIYIKGKSKRAKRLRTLPAPREKKSKAQDQETDQAASKSLSTAPYTLAPVGNEAGSIDLSGFNLAPSPMELLESLDSWPHSMHDDFMGTHFTSENSVGQPRAVSMSSTVLPLPPTSDSTRMTSGQASLLDALFSLGNSPDSLVSSTNVISTARENTTYVSCGSTWLSPDTEEDDPSCGEEDPEGVIQIICQPLPLDKNAECNALPFVLQNYAMWVARMAYEPLKSARLVRNFVIKQFGDGLESRWTLTLLANIGGLLGRGVSIDGAHFTAVSTLQNQVRRRLSSAKTIEDDEIARPELVKALDATLETIAIYFFVSPISKWMTLWKESAPVFRRLCPEPPGSPINLPSLLQHPDVSLRRYAQIDVLYSALMDVPMLFRYNCSPQSAQPICEPTGEPRHDSGAQWFYGTPDRFLAMFAKINAMREDGWVATPEIIAVFERGIKEFQPTQSTSHDSFMSVTRLVVQECWRQVAYVYLYMGLCGDSSDTPRVKQALKQFIKLLDGTKPGRRPDEFLVLNLVLIAPAARKKCDRETIRRRVHGLRVNGPSHGADDNMSIIESLWAHADAEGRPVVWSDISPARTRIIGCL